MHGISGILLAFICSAIVDTEVLENAAGDIDIDEDDMPSEGSPSVTLFSSLELNLKPSRGVKSIWRYNSAGAVLLSLFKTDD